MADIRRALLRFKVVFFRDQNLDHEAHVRFARCFGVVIQHHPMSQYGKGQATNIVDIDLGAAIEGGTRFGSHDQ